MAKALILGCGFTGSRVSRLLQEKGWETRCTRREGELRLDVEDPRSFRAVASVLTPQTVVLHSIPAPGVAPLLRELPPARVVYLSTTGVYGAASRVDENTPAAPRTERERARFAEERAILSGPWSALVLRPAAIYGPGRGVHAAMRKGVYRLAAGGNNFVSRIHVDDLAALAAAAMDSCLTGAYPVADALPCASREIAAYCAQLLGIPMPESAEPEELSETRRADRQVDGSAIFRELGVALLYPSYREGIPASLEAEARALPIS